MATVRRSLEDIRRRKPTIDHARIDATTEDDIRRHMIEDGENPDAEPSEADVITPAAIRQRLDMSQTAFAEALMIPVATLRNWEQGRTIPDPAARSLMRAVAGDPARVFALIRGATEAAE